MVVGSSVDVGLSVVVGSSVVVGANERKRFSISCVGRECCLFFALN